MISLKESLGDFRRLSEFSGVVYNETTGQFLHMNGVDLTNNRDHAWYGRQPQLARLRKKQRSANERWGHKLLDLTGFKFRKDL